MFTDKDASISCTKKKQEMNRTPDIVSKIIKAMFTEHVFGAIFIGVLECCRLIYFIGNVRWGLLRIKYIPSSIGVWLLAFHGAWRAFWFNNICYSDIIFSVLCWPCKHGHISGLQFVREICVQSF